MKCRKSSDKLPGVDKEKAPGSNGFSIAFSRAVGKNMNSSFITRVPNKDRSFKVKNYRPITIVSGFYKVISKFLSMRLSDVSLNICPLTVYASSQAGFLITEYVRREVLQSHVTVNMFGN